MLFYVGAFRPNGTEILGNLGGQGFYNYKRLSTVIKILKENHIGKNEKYYNVDKVTYKIWSINENEKYKNFEQYKDPIVIL